MDESWVKSFLVKHQFGPSAHPELQTTGGEFFAFDGAVAGRQEIITALETEASGLGMAAAPDLEDRVITEYLKTLTDGQGTADDLSKGIDADDPRAALQRLQQLPMTGLLAALDKLKSGGKLDRVMEFAKENLKDKRLVAAILTVQGNIGEEWRSNVDGLGEDEKIVLRGYALGKMDNGAYASVKSLGFADPGGDDAAWLKGFFTFVDLQGPPTKGQSTGDYLFRSELKTMDQVVDLTTGQAALAGRILDAGTVRSQAQAFGTANPMSPGAPPKKGEDDPELKLTKDEKGVVAASVEVTVDGNSLGPIKVEFKTSSEGLELQASKEFKKDVLDLIHSRLGSRVFKKIELGVSFNASIAVDPTKAKQSLVAFKAEIEGDLEFEFKEIPGIKVTIPPIQFKVTVDPATGKVSPGFEITIVSW